MRKRILLVAFIGAVVVTGFMRALAEVAPGRWWLADPRDREAAAAPLADRVEWAVFSLLSTAGRLSSNAGRNTTRSPAMRRFVSSGNAS